MATVTSPLKKLLIRHEGIRLKPYVCPAGKLSIGVGRNLQDNGITLDEAITLLDNDVAVVAREAKENFYWFIDLDEPRQAVILSMIFNMGLGKFKEFKKMIAHMEDKNHDFAADEMLQSRWAQQVGKRALELAYMMRRGKYQD